MRPTSALLLLVACGATPEPPHEESPRVTSIAVRRAQNPMTVLRSGQVLVAGGIDRLAAQGVRPPPQQSMGGIQ